MQKLGQIQLQKTVTVKVECNLNDQIVVKNFKILMDCLKDLNANHNDLASKFSSLSDRVSTVEKNSHHSDHIPKQQVHAAPKKDTGVAVQPQSSVSVQQQQFSSQQKQNLLELIKQLQNRTGQNQKNILDNIKDINLLNKEVSDLKDQLSKIKSHAGSNNNTNNNVTDASDKKQSQGKQGKDGITRVVGMDSITNINKEMQNNKQSISKMSDDLDQLRKQLANLKEKLNKITGEQDRLNKEMETKSNINKGENNNNNSNNSGGQSGDLNKAELSQLRQKIAILNKKTNGLEMETGELKNETVSLGEGQDTLENTCNNLIKEIEQLRQLINNLSQNNKGGEIEKGNRETPNLNISINDDIKLIKMELRELRNQIDELKKQTNNNNNSKTSIDDDRRLKIDRGAYTHTKLKDESLKDIIGRLEYLEKILGSRTSIDDKNSDKLPLIKRNRVKDRESSIHDKSSSKKDIADIKAELQAWLNNYLTEMKSKDSLEDIELRLQEIKNNLNRKADQEGLKKGLTFLQNKINQLYLFLTEPDGDDAMIVRKGFNCLSCSKKVEKLRGKIGPHINWNNMTQTNYSPPKVGYSRHMAETSGQKEDDQQ